MTSEPIDFAYIVFHSADMDGLCSAWVTQKYLKEKLNHRAIYIPYNHGENFPSEVIVPNKDIYIVDVILPDEYMKKYVNNIIWIDHHVSSIEKINALNLTFKGNYSSVNGDDGKQISACELCWNTLFNERPMPRLVHLCGRYDVWDKSVVEADYLNSYFRENYRLGTYNLSNVIEDNFTVTDEMIYILDTISGETEEKYKRLESVLKFGNMVYEERKKYYAQLCQMYCEKYEINGHKCAVIKTREGDSSLFNSFVDNNPDVEYLISYNFNKIKHFWKFSVYNSPTNQNGDALEFLTSIINGDKKNVSSFGGHKAACGASLSLNGSIDEVLLNKMTLLDSVK